MSNRRTVFLACPYGQVGGGMGSIMAYLASLQQDPSGQFDLKRLESRGGGHIAFSPFFLALAVGRIILEAMRGRLAVVHLNLAERVSESGVARGNQACRRTRAAASACCADRPVPSVHGRNRTNITAVDVSFR